MALTLHSSFLTDPMTVYEPRLSGSNREEALLFSSLASSYDQQRDMSHSGTALFGDVVLGGNP